MVQSFENYCLVDVKSGFPFEYKGTFLDFPIMDIKRGPTPSDEGPGNAWGLENRTHAPHKRTAHPTSLYAHDETHEAATGAASRANAVTHICG